MFLKVGSGVKGKVFDCSNSLNFLKLIYNSGGIVRFLLICGLVLLVMLNYVDYFGENSLNLLNGNLVSECIVLKIGVVSVSL